LNLGKVLNKKNIANILLVFTILLIIVQTIFYFLISDIVLSPDYDYHYYLATLFRDNPLTVFFFNLEGLDLCSFLSGSRVGLVMTGPNIYGNITGKLLFLINLLISNESLSLNIVSLLQTSFGLLNIYYIYKISGFVFKKKLPRVFVIFILTNIQMFSYLMNYLTYDNLVNLASSASIYYLLNYLKEKDIKNVFLLGIFLCIGILTKYTFGVLLVMIILVLLFHARLRIKEFIKDINKFIFNKKNLFLKLILFVLISLNIFFYAHNIIVNKTLIPSPGAGRRYCSQDSSKQVEEIEIIEQGTPVVETEIFKEGGENLQEQEVKKDNVFSYFRHWFLLMVGRTFNIASHKSLSKPTIFTRVFSFLIILSFLLFLVKYRFKDKYINILVLFLLGYISFLFFFRYNIYISREEDSGNLGIAGRYMFPVISSFVILFVYSFWNISKKKIVPIIILILISVFFLYSDKIFLLQNYRSWAVVNGSQRESETRKILEGETSPNQKFYVEEEFTNNEIAVYASTLYENIEEGFRFNLYKEDCSTLIGRYDLERISDNRYYIIEFSEGIEYDEMYCFNIENVGSEEPIVLWYSENDLNGYIEGEEQRDILYSPIEKYGLDFLEEFFL
jgi:hypothetical protein